MELECGDPAITAAASLLMNRLDDDEAPIRASAITLLCAVLSDGAGGGGGKAKAAANAATETGIKALMARIEDPSEEVRVACLRGLAGLANKGDAAVTAAFVACSADPDAG